MERQNISTGTSWEARVGYSRAVHIGSHVWVSGTTATDDAGNIVGEDAYSQTVQILKNIGIALRRSGSSFEDVVRTRIFVTAIENWQEVGRAHGEIFGAVRPATTMVEVSALIAPEILVEIEADAFIREEA